MISDADKNVASTLVTHFADDVRLYRNGSSPFIGKAAAQAKLRETSGTFVSTPVSARMSSSADLGYTYGTAEIKPADSTKPSDYFSYLRIWKKQQNGSWKIVLDLLSPAPKP